MDIRFCYEDDDSSSDLIEIKLHRTRPDRFTYTKIENGTEIWDDYWYEFKRLANQWRHLFLPAVWSRKSKLEELMDGQKIKKNKSFSEQINQSIMNVIDDVKVDISIFVPHKGVSIKKMAKEKWKTVQEMFLWKRALAELFAELYSLDEWSLFMIDEVEQALHFDIHKRLLIEIKRIARERGLRIILTTHSHYVFNAANSTQRYLLSKEAGSITITPWASLKATIELDVIVNRTIYIVEDNLAKAIFQKQYVMQYWEKANIIRWGGYAELFDRVDDLKSLYEADTFIMVFDPDVSNDEIIKIKKERWWSYRHEKLWNDEWDKIPQRILLEFAFKKNTFINRLGLDQCILKADLMPIIKWLEEGTSINAKSDLYKVLYRDLISKDDEEHLLTAYERS